MIFPLILLTPIGVVILGYGIWQVYGLKRKEGWLLIAIGLLLSVGSFGLLVFSLLVFASGM